MDPALWELLRAEAGADGDREIEAIIRLARPGIDVPGVRIVSRFGTIVTCRIAASDVVAVRARPDVVSVKAALSLSPGFEPPAGPADRPSPAQPAWRGTDVRRGPALGLTGAGVVVAAVDWGVDLDCAAFRWPADSGAGGTRFLSFWDQRDQALGPRLAPYGYGAVHHRADIDRALRGPRPYEHLGYHPGIADKGQTGAHGTHCLDIAAGNGRAGGPAGIAPESDLIFAHLADRNTGGLANFGDSVRLLEAVDFISRAAGAQPCVINISADRTCGPRDGTTVVERALDELLATAPGRFVVDSAGNYRRWRTHASGTLATGETRSLTLVTDPADITLNEIEVWYDGADEFTVRIDPPGFAGARPVCLGERSDILDDGEVVGRVYHRRHDPNNGANHIVAYLDPVGRAGDWTITLEARRARSGRFHAWIERDDSCRGCQARFTRDDSDPATTIGAITTSHLPLIVAAYDGHDPARPAAPFSSAGPTRDRRDKPDLAAPGVGVLAARSAPVTASRNAGLLVRKSGTSMAAPHVTGAVALCFQAAGRRLSAREIRALVVRSCDPVPDPGLRDRLGRGYLNISRLAADVERVLAAPATAPATAGPTLDKEPTMNTDDAMVLLAADPATAYREYLYRPHGPLAGWVSDRFQVVARPGQPISRAPREGDVLIEVTLGRLGQGRCVALAARDRDRMAARRWLPPGQLLLRPRPLTQMSDPLPVEPVVDATGGTDAAGTDTAGTEAAGADVTGSTDAAGTGDTTAEHDFGDDLADDAPPVRADAAAAVPPFSPAERVTVVEPLLSARESGRAVAWSRSTHPGRSGVTLGQIRAALGGYVDAAAVQVAIGRRNHTEPGDPIDASGPATDAVLVECVHQFQVKCYCERREHDGQAGASTLESLGLIVSAGSGLRGVAPGNATAQDRLDHNDAQVKAATSAEFSAANWFGAIIDPAVFGWRTKSGHGLHVLLVRKLRQAERYLLTLPAFRGQTPAALGRTLGLTEPHGGARPAAVGSSSVHTFGLAIDIAYRANPWVRDAASWQALQRAGALVSGISLTPQSAPAYFSSLGSDPARSTGQVWDELQRRNHDLMGYFQLGEDAAKLQAALLSGQVRGTAGLMDRGESLEGAAARWRARIQHDRDDLARGDFKDHEPPGRGFLTHARDLVVALRDHGCLVWGAVDLGPGARGSGDMMHFDARIDGAGRVLATATAAGLQSAFVPAAGHHPCRPAASSTGPVPGEAIPGGAVPAEAVFAEAAPAEAVFAEAAPAEAVFAEAGHAEAVPAEAGHAEAVPAEGTGGSATADYLDGKLWTFPASTTGRPVAVFCPRAALARDQVEVLLYVHGLLDGVRDMPVPDGFITDRRFAFGSIVRVSGRPMVVVVPALDWAHPGGAAAFGDGHPHWNELARPDHLNSLIAEVLAEAGRRQGLAAPTLSNLIIAGHSRAYDFLEPLAHSRRNTAMHEGALARLSQVWAFDTSYAGRVENWTDWLTLNPQLRMHLFYRPGSPTAAVGDEFYRRRGPRLAVTWVNEDHGAVPKTRLRALLDPPAHAPGEAAEDDKTQPAVVPPPPAGPAPVVQPAADELTKRIARCIGIWETNRGKDDPAPHESALDTVAGVHASMATWEQATMPYAITVLKRNKALRDQASPALTMKELNTAEARVSAVPALLSSVTAWPAGKTPDDFIAAHAAAIGATGLSNDDVRTMFRAVTLKGVLDQARAGAEAADHAARQQAAQQKKTHHEQATAGAAARQKAVTASIDAIAAADRLGLGEASLKAYIRTAGNWGENRAGWQRKAVANMPDHVGGRIEAVTVSDDGKALIIPTVRARVDAELVKVPAPGTADIVKTVAQQNNPGETDYGTNIWASYHRLYP